MPVKFYKVFFNNIKQNILLIPYSNNSYAKKAYSKELFLKFKIYQNKAEFISGSFS